MSGGSGCTAIRGRLNCVAAHRQSAGEACHPARPPGAVPPTTARPTTRSESSNRNRSPPPAAPGSRSRPACRSLRSPSPRRRRARCRRTAPPAPRAAPPRRPGRAASRGSAPAGRPGSPPSADRSRVRVEAQHAVHAEPREGSSRPTVSAGPARRRSAASRARSSSPPYRCRRLAPRSRIDGGGEPDVGGSGLDREPVRTAPFSVDRRRRRAAVGRARSARPSNPGRGAATRSAGPWPASASTVPRPGRPRSRERKA